MIELKALFDLLQRIKRTESLVGIDLHNVMKIGRYHDILLGRAVAVRFGNKN